MFIIYLLKLISLSYGCQNDFSVRDELERNPLSAKGIVIGRVQQEGEGLNVNYYLNVEYSLTKSVARVAFKSSASDQCDRPPSVPNKRYLVLSSNSLEKLSFSSPLGNSKNLIIELSDSEKIVRKLADLRPLEKQSINPFWKFCKNDNECKIVNFCGKKMSLSNRFEKLYSQDLKDLTCKSNTSLNKSDDNAKCIDNLCEF